MQQYRGYNGGGYGQQQNPYSQNTYGEGGRGYDGQIPPGGRYGGPQPEVEMQSYNDAQGGGHSGGRTDGPDILDQCRAIDKAVDDLDSQLLDLQGLHSRVLNDRASNTEVDRRNAEIMAAYRNLGDKLKKVKSNRESGSPRNAPQVGRVDRKLKKAINDYQRVESDFRKQMQEQQARQYRIVRPDASDAEVQDAVEEPNAQIFQQALLSSNRQGQSQTALNAVRQRHNEIQRIEQTIMELAELFQDLDVIVTEQEPLIQNIEQKGEEIHENVQQANVELSHGVKSARGARKKKWICFFICLVVLIVIAVAVAIYVVTNKKSSNTTVVSTPAATTKAAGARMVKRLLEAQQPQASYNS
ncbi:putative snare domain-containing protein [Venturia nashicola]|uniref:Putative snare domain-containing protein n=1 Tax=Venturia nashicola TaxID=86259 RepID=A0A4Z1P578_9PEZI|nr:putative snare domain-containing protein [Venturia nashicola]TLD35639.1 putative snare domain-containing protein [Venturia nashicola]